MRLILQGPSALAWWLTAPARPPARGVTDDRVLQSGGINAAALSYLRERAPFVPAPIHLLTRVWNRPQLPDCRIHSSRHKYPRGSFIRVDHGIVVSSPELCLAQLACRISSPHLVQAASALCAAFALDPHSPGGLARREPLTDTARLASYLSRCAPIDGSRILRGVLPFVAQCAYSPPEIFMHMVLNMPAQLGGFGLKGISANDPIAPSRRAQRISERRTLIPDLCWAEAKLAVEYDSNAEHLTPQQVARDARKRLALEADGYRVITVTTSQLASSRSMEEIAREISRHLHRRLRIRSTKFRACHAALYRMGWSLDHYLDGRWLAQQWNLGQTASPECGNGTKLRPEVPL